MESSSTYRHNMHRESPVWDYSQGGCSENAMGTNWAEGLMPPPVTITEFCDRTQTKIFPQRIANVSKFQTTVAEELALCSTLHVS